MRTTSAKTRRNDSAQSKIERINWEAREILSQKEEEIQEFEEAIDESEKKLARLQAEIKEKQRILEALNGSSDNLSQSEDSEEEIDLVKLKAQYDAEVQQARATYEEETQRLQAGMVKSLKEAEEWAESHAESVFAEKRGELEDLRHELEGLKALANQNAFTAHQSRNKFFQESKNLSMQNAKRIQILDSELSELASVTREELREVKAKIDECLVLVHVREQTHANEIEKYNFEIKKREEKYNNHLAILAEQYDNEKQRLNQHLKATNSKKTNLEKVIAQIEKHHENQLQTTLRDIERMRSTIYQSQSKETNTFMETKNYLTKVQSVQRDCKHAEQELQLVNNEIKDLAEENKLLQNELNRLGASIETNKNLNIRRF